MSEPFDDAAASGMKVERRQPTPREWAVITSARPVVRVVSRRPEKSHTPGPMRPARSQKFLPVQNSVTTRVRQQRAWSPRAAPTRR
jgi:hypothetical protein